jgi:hypothetical protein
MRGLGRPPSSKGPGRAIPQNATETARICPPLACKTQDRLDARRAVGSERDQRPDDPALSAASSPPSSPLHGLGDPLRATAPRVASGDPAATHDREVDARRDPDSLAGVVGTRARSVCDRRPAGWRRREGARRCDAEPFVQCARGHHASWSRLSRAAGTTMGAYRARARPRAPRPRRRKRGHPRTRAAYSRDLRRSITNEKPGPSAFAARGLQPARDGESRVRNGRGLFDAIDAKPWLRSCRDRRRASCCVTKSSTGMSAEPKPECSAGNVTRRHRPAAVPQRSPLSLLSRTHFGPLEFAQWPACQL